FSPDGKRVALWPVHVASAGQIWDVQPSQPMPMDPTEPDNTFPKSRRLLKTVKGHLTGVVHVAFSADGTRLYSADGNGTLKEGDAPKGPEPPGASARGPGPQFARGQADPEDQQGRLASTRHSECEGDRDSGSRCRRQATAGLHQTSGAGCARRDESRRA